MIPVINTYELRLKKALVDLGPMISIGRPGEALPKIGSARFYVSNDEWQSAIRHFIDRAVAVVIMMGPTRGLLWEVQTALRCADPERLLFFFPYVSSKKRSPSWWYRFRLGTNLYQKPRGDRLRDMVKERDTRYQLFRGQVLDIIPFTLPTSLEDASFLTYTADGQPNLLRTEQPLRALDYSNPNPRLKSTLSAHFVPLYREYWGNSISQR